MCRLVCKAVNHGNMQVLNDVRSILKIKTYIPSDPNELCNRIFVTCYMGTENSSEDTKERAKLLSKDIGSYHLGGSFVLCKALFWNSQSTTDKSTLIPPNFLVGKFCAKAQFPQNFRRIVRSTAEIVRSHLTREEGGITVFYAVTVYWILNDMIPNILNEIQGNCCATFSWTVRKAFGIIHLVRAQNFL